MIIKVQNTQQSLCGSLTLRVEQQLIGHRCDGNLAEVSADKVTKLRAKDMRELVPC